MVDIVNYWPDQDSIDNNTPVTLPVGWAEKTGNDCYVHGTTSSIRGLQFSLTIGDPLQSGINPDGIAPALLADDPTVGGCTMRTPPWGMVAEHPSSPTAYPVTGGNWATIVGGTLDEVSVDVTWDDATGTMTLVRGCSWRISFTLSMAWAIGILIPSMTAGLVINGVLSNYRITCPFSALSDGKFFSAGGPIFVPALSTVRLQINSTQTGTANLLGFTMTAMK